MLHQTTSCVLMVRPDHFGYNSQTAVTNPFQHSPKELHKSPKEIQADALFEFSSMVKKLQENGVEVLVMSSTEDAITPDAIFPNNWFSTHQDGKLVFYPMLTPNRRFERQKQKVLALLKKAGIINPEIVDLTNDEERGLILESTGSMVLDHIHKDAFAMASPRTVQEEFDTWCQVMGYQGVFIKTLKSHEKEVYHTNIVMSIASEFAVVCLDVIAQKKEKEIIRNKIASLGKECIEISLLQVYKFCGNILELQSKNGDKLLVMSDTAREAFTSAQLKRLKHYCKIISFAIPTIEEVGGGGVRCMLAEIFFTQHV